MNEDANESYMRVEGPTPHGGAYGTIFYCDDNGKASDKDHASRAIAAEFDEQGCLICEAFMVSTGKTKPRKEKSNKHQEKQQEEIEYDENAPTLMLGRENEKSSQLNIPYRHYGQSGVQYTTNENGTLGLKITLLVSGILLVVIICVILAVI